MLKNFITVRDKNGVKITKTNRDLLVDLFGYFSVLTSLMSILIPIYCIDFFLEIGVSLILLVFGIILMIVTPFIIFANKRHVKKRSVTRRHALNLILILTMFLFIFYLGIFITYYILFYFLVFTSWFVPYIILSVTTIGLGWMIFIVD